MGIRYQARPTAPYLILVDDAHQSLPHRRVADVLHGSGITNARSRFESIRPPVRGETSLLRHPLPTVSEYLDRLTSRWSIVRDNKPAAQLPAGAEPRIPPLFCGSVDLVLVFR